MDRESVERLRFDRRLQRRRGWVEPTQYDDHVESLPDVSGKMTRGLDEEEGAGAAPPPPPVQTEPSAPAPVPTAGSFPGES